MRNVRALRLKNFIPADGVNITTFVHLAKHITAELAQLHRDQGAHKSINAYHIRILQQGDQTPAVFIDDPQQYAVDDALLANLNDAAVVQHLPHMSPEQTGRINRLIDQRTDLYSLGVVLYELATGQLPFPETDPMLLMHSQIAKRSPRISDIKPQWPKVVSNIVCMLLEKTPDNRYHTCEGLYADLEECAVLLEQGDEAPFVVGRCNFDEHLHMPPRLYGRANELIAMGQKYQSVISGSHQIMILSGPGGSGKTALVVFLFKVLSSRLHLWRRENLINSIMTLHTVR